MATISTMHAPEEGRKGDLAIDSPLSSLGGLSLTPPSSPSSAKSSPDNSLDSNNISLDSQRETASPDTMQQLDDGSEEIKCSAVHTLDRDMPDFDYSHLVRELRDRILEYVAKNEGICSATDFDRCKNDDWFLSRFLLRHKLDLNKAFEMLKNALRFRYESLVNSIRPEDFPAEFYQIGGLFGYEPDRRGNLMLYIRVKSHYRVSEINSVIQTFLYFRILQLDELAKGKGISIVFDCTGGGLANADMDMLFFLISTLVNYFPKGMSYLLVHELPWLLKPFWHIAKNWISEEHRQLIKFSNSQTIFEYVAKENLPDFMGGTCKRDYRAAPDNCSSLQEASKLWGVENKLVRRIIMKFQNSLPEEVFERALRACDAEEARLQSQASDEQLPSLD